MAVLGAIGAGAPAAHASLCVLNCNAGNSSGSGGTTSGPACSQIGSKDFNPSDAVVPPALGRSLLPRRSSGGVQFGFAPMQLSDSKLPLSKQLRFNHMVGTNVEKIVVTWAAIEQKQGQRDFYGYDSLYCSLRAAGIRPLWTILGVPHWALAAGSDCPAGTMSCPEPPAPAQLGALRDFMSAFAIRYPESAGIEAWNEPNVSLYWEHPSPQAYVGVLRSIYEGVKDVNPSMPVLGGALSEHEADYADGTMAAMEFLGDIYADGAGQFMDAISMHPYPRPTAGSDHVSSLVAQARAIAASYDGPGERHLWLTEIGASIVDSDGWGFTEDSQANALLSAHDTANAAPDIDLTLYHVLLDPPDEHAYGWIKRPNAAGKFYGRQVFCTFANRFGPAKVDCRKPLK